MYLVASRVYYQQPVLRRDNWLRKHGLVAARFKQFISAADHIRKQVQTMLIGRDRRKPFESPSHDSYRSNEMLNDWQINALRLLLVWTCDNNFLIMKPIKTLNSIGIISTELNEAHLSALFPVSSKIKWRLEERSKRSYTGISCRPSTDYDDIMSDMCGEIMISTFITILNSFVFH